MFENSFVVCWTIFSEEMRPGEDEKSASTPLEDISQLNLYGNPANVGSLYDRSQMPAAKGMVLRPLAVYHIGQCFISCLVPRTLQHC
jgi:hypothetical protein